MIATKVYVCSSWRNEYYDFTLECLHDAGFKIWNWREPPTGGNGFKWQDAGLHSYEHGALYSVEGIRSGLRAPAAERGFASDLAGMNWCDTGLILFPCGKSAHAEAGWLAGRGKTVHAIMPEPCEPDLMLKLFNGGLYPDIDSFIRHWRS